MFDIWQTNREPRADPLILVYMGCTHATQPGLQVAMRNAAFNALGGLLEHDVQRPLKYRFHLCDDT